MLLKIQVKQESLFVIASPALYAGRGNPVRMSKRQRQVGSAWVVSLIIIMLFSVLSVRLLKHAVWVESMAADIAQQKL